MVKPRYLTDITRKKDPLQMALTAIWVFVGVCVGIGICYLIVC